VAQIAASIVEFGWTTPILVDGDSTVVAGHGRLLAARKLGLDTIPVVVLGYLTPAQRCAYVIADNKLALNAGWNEELLASELHALNGEGLLRLILLALLQTFASQPALKSAS
jgi:ParB-like chromosome segregation protein Spo0J